MLSFLKPILNFKTLSYFLFYCTGHFFFISSGVRGDSHLPDFKGWSALKLCNKCYLSPIQYLFITPPPISPSSMASTPPYSKPTLSFASSYFRVWQLHLPFLLPIFFSHLSSNPGGKSVSSTICICPETYLDTNNLTTSVKATLMKDTFIFDWTCGVLICLPISSLSWVYYKNCPIIVYYQDTRLTLTKYKSNFITSLLRAFQWLFILLRRKS